MLYAITIIVVLIACFLLLRLRFSGELTEKRRLLFLGIGRSGLQIDFNSHVSRIKLCGWTVRSLKHDSGAKLNGEDRTGPIKAVKITKAELGSGKRPGRKRGELHLRAWLEIGLQVLRALRRYVIDLLRSVIVEEAEAEIRAGFESPHLTGEAFGYYHALIGAVPALAPRLRFYPDWTGQSFTGSARLSLAIPMYALVYRTGLMIIRLPLIRLMKMVREQRKGAAYAK